MTIANMLIGCKEETHINLSKFNRSRI